MKLCVVIPTWRRPSELARCLEGLGRQTRAADRVILVVRENDQVTKKFLETSDADRLTFSVTNVIEPGVVAALNCGLAAAAEADIITFADDDTVPRPDWLERIEGHFAADPCLGALGGRDELHPPSMEAPQATVGKLRWYGRLTGNHHLGVGRAREVDVVKGANMSLRRAALDHAHVDERLQGPGAQAHWEIDLCLAVKRRGWKLVYDPAVLVDHYPAERPEDDSRLGPVTGMTLEHVIHNETYLLLKWLPWRRRIAAVTYWLLVGTRLAPGLLLLLERLARDGDRRSVLRRYGAALRGRGGGARTFIGGRPEHSNVVSAHVRDLR